MVLRSSVERVKELTRVLPRTTPPKVSSLQIVVVQADLSFIGGDVNQLGCPQRQVQREPGSRIANIASDQLADPA